MTDLIVIVPSRGRPQAARELAECFRATCTAATALVFALDDDDPTRDEYAAAAGADFISGPSRTMVEALNTAATWYAGQTFALGFMGDDHRPRTHGWDSMYVEELRELGTGIVYGNDLLQGERIPTQVAMTADIVRTLGFMAPPPLTHLFVDNYWRDLGGLAPCLRYLPHVVIEHMHPVAGKAGWDAGHIRVNTSAMYQRDLAAYSRYVAEHLPADLGKVRALR